MCICLSWRRHDVRPYQKFSVYRSEGRHGAFPITRKESSMRPHISLDVRDVPASVKFYQKVFGVAYWLELSDELINGLREPVTFSK